jgi:hypothetical protein
MLVTIQSEFHMAYPHLRLEFYHKPHGVYEESSRRDIADPGLKVSDIGLSDAEGTLEASPETMVSDFESQLLEKFGLSAQVFRHSGGKWVQTTASDQWTLGQQNLHGESSSAIYRHLKDKE